MAGRVETGTASRTPIRGCTIKPPPGTYSLELDVVLQRGDNLRVKRLTPTNILPTMG